MLFQRKSMVLSAWAAVAMSWAGAGYGVAVEAQSAPGPIDTAPPVVGALVAPPVTASFPLSVQYTGVADTGSGSVARVELWSRAGTGLWSGTGLTDLTGQAAGSFSFQPPSAPAANTTFHFLIVAEDSFGNSMPQPVGNSEPGTATTLFQPVSTVSDWMLY